MPPINEQQLQAIVNDAEAGQYMNYVLSKLDAKERTALRLHIETLPMTTAIESIKTIINGN